MVGDNLIYALKDPRTGEVRYIGMTTKGMERPKYHALLAATGEQSHKANWIRQLQALGLQYEIEVLEDLQSSEKLPGAEREWIAHFRSEGVELTNLTDGGEGPAGLKHTVEAKAKMSVARKGNPGYWTGRHHTAETKQKLSEAVKGFKHTEEAKRKISKALKGNQYAKALKGRKIPEEVKAKMRASWAAKRRARERTQQEASP